jgi:hypothetical protein
MRLTGFKVRLLLHGSGTHHPVFHINLCEDFPSRTAVFFIHHSFGGEGGSSRAVASGVRDVDQEKELVHRRKKMADAPKA